MSEFDEWFKLKYPNFYNNYVSKDNIASVIHVISQDSWNHQQKKIDDLEIKLSSHEYSTRECLNAMSLSCVSYLNENKKLKSIINEMNDWMKNQTEKHMSTHAYLGILDILEKNKELLNEPN